MASVPSKSTNEPPPPTRDPSTLILRIGDTLSSHVDEIDRAYRVYTASLWVVGVLAFVDTLFIVSIWTSATLLTQVIFASFDAILIGFVVYGLWAKKGFGLVDDIDWEVNRFRFITTFELLPPEGNTPSERIWNSLKRASTAAEELQDLPADKVKFDVEVDGKSGKRYLFDVSSREPDSLVILLVLPATARKTPRGPSYDPCEENLQNNTGNQVRPGDFEERVRRCKQEAA